MQGPYHVMLAFWPWILDGAIRAFRSFEATLFSDIANYRANQLYPNNYQIGLPVYFLSSISTKQGDYKGAPESHPLLCLKKMSLNKLL